MAAKPFESKIQDLVYNVDVGIGLRVIKLALYLLAILSIMLLYTVTQFKGLKNEQSMDYAQLGRNVLERHAFTTQCIRPASMWYLMKNTAGHKPQIDEHPDIMHPPLYPLVLAAGYKMTGASFDLETGSRSFPPEHWVVIPVGHLFTVLTGILVFLLGVHLFDKKVAWLGMTLYFLSNLVWSDSISGLPLPMVTFLVTGALYAALVAVTRNRDGQSLASWLVPFILSLVACVLAFLTRYGAAVIVPALVVFYGVSLKQKKWMWASLFLVAFLVGISPWLARNQVVSGGLLGLTPHTALNDTSLYEGDSFNRTLAPTHEWKGVTNALKQKWMKNMARYTSTQLFLLGDGVLMCFFITTFFYRFVRRNVHVFRWCLVISILLLLCLAGFYGDATMQLLHMFWPVVILYGLAFFFILLDRLQFRARLFSMGVTVLVVFLSALPLVFSLLPPREGTPYPPYFQPYIQHVCHLLKPNELLCTDMPWATAWYGRRNSFQLPMTIDDFYEINDYNKRISGLYLTTITRNQPYASTLMTGSYRTWFPILEGKIPSDFPLTQGFPIGNMDQIFLTDRARWAE